MIDQPDIDEIERVVDKIKRAGQIEKTVIELEKKLLLKEQQINDSLKILPLWDGTYQELMEHPFPILIETVKKYAQKKNELDQNRQNVNDRIRTQKENIEGYEKQIRELESLAKIPSEDQLLGSRNHRDQGWRFIRTKLEKGSWDEGIGGFTGGQSIENVYEESVRNSDQIADNMRFEATKLGEKNKYLSDIENCKDKMIGLESEADRISQKTSKWETSWNMLWEPYGIIPLTPVEMTEWLTKYKQIKTMVQELYEGKAELKKIENQKSEYKSLLINALARIVSVTEEKTLEDLLTVAENQIKKIREYINKQNALIESISEDSQRKEKIKTQLTDSEGEITIWHTDWVKAIDGTSIKSTTQTSVAETLLDKYENLVQNYDRLQILILEKEKTEKQLESFEGKTKNVLQEVSIELDEQNVAVAVNSLYMRLQKAQTDQETMKRDQDKQKKINAKLKTAGREIEESEATLNELLQQAGCTSVEDLEEAEKAFVLKKSYQTDIQEIEEELFQIGNGRSLNTLNLEANQIEQDGIEAELEDIQRSLDGLDFQRSKLEQDHGAVKKEYEEKIQGNNTASVSAEQQKESALAKISNLTEQYIQLKLVSSLLQKGIEHFRSQNQDPILKRAGELFAKLTLQSFTGLAVDYNEQDQPVLMGTRLDGDKVSIEGMSDGTTDQLYLPLRIASIEKYVQNNESIPFIVDDILVHFDDIRSKETLKVLLELSKHTQIIFFTHHERLIKTMEQIATDDKYQLLELNHEHISVLK